MPEIIRPAKLSDLKALLELASVASLGLTSLPKNEELLKEKIEASLEKKARHPKLFLFVLEDLDEKRVVGTCQISSRSGYPGTTHFYKLYDEEGEKLLRITTHQRGPTEIKGLYLHPEYRKANLGKLLSYCRFFFIANFRREFTDKVVAEMRGFIDEKGESPFWNALGRHFSGLSLEEALENSTRSHAFVPFILPKYPIYQCLLPLPAQEAINRTHPSKETALRLLLKEGFALAGEVDIFDAGPKVFAETDSIHTLKESRLVEAALLEETPHEERFMLSNLSIDFRATVSAGKLEGKKVLLPRQTLDLLSALPGDRLRLIHY